MVVRLSDLRNGKKSDEGSQKGSLVRLSDLRTEQQQSTSDASLRNEKIRTIQANASKAPARSIPVNTTYNKDIPVKAQQNNPQEQPSFGQRALGAVRATGQFLADFPAEFTDSATFGLSSLTGRIMGVETKDEQDERNQRAGGKAGEIAGYFMPGTAIEKGVVAVAKPLIKNAPRAVQLATTGAAAGAIEATAQEGADVAFRGDTFDPLNIAIGTAGGGFLNPALDLAGKGVQRLVGTFRPNKVLDAIPQSGPVLSLPEPRPRGNINKVDTPDVINVPETGPRALPEPNVAPPTTARVERQANLFRERLEAFAHSMRGVQMPPGREREAFLEAWGRFARPDDPDLETMIDLAYSSRPNRVTPDLAQRARETQRAREVAGVGVPVRSMSDRYKGGVFGSADSPIPTAGRRTAQQPRVVRLNEIRNGNTIDVPARRINETAATAEVLERPLERPLQQPTTSPRKPVQPLQQRGFVDTLRQSGKLSDETIDSLAAAQGKSYKPLTNESTVNKANKRLDKDIDAAEAFVLNGKKGTPEQIATGMRLIDELQKGGQTERAVTVALNISKKLTEAGQTVQAASIWNRLTPEGALVAATRKVEQINQEATRFAKPLEVTPKIADDIMSAAGAIQRNGASKERAAQVMDIAERLKKGENVSAEDRELVSEFVKDLSTFVKKDKTPRPPRMPREMSEPRVRDRVVSFLEEQEKAAMDRLRAKGVRISSTPLDVWADMSYVLALRLAKGTVKATDAAEFMVKEFGESIRPHVAGIFERAQDILTQNSKRISERAVSQAEKIAETYLRKNEAKVKPADAEFIRKMARNVSELSGEAQKVASMDLQAIMSGFEKAGIGRKVSSAQYISMLLNPVTQVRNIVGNEMLYRIERLNRLIATPADIVASKASGKPREITFSKGPTAWENFFAPSKDFAKGLVIGSKAGWRGVNPEGLTTSYDISGQAFRSKLNPLTYLEKTLGAVMKGFDYAAYNRAVNQRLREMSYLDALNSGVKGKDNIRAHMEKYAANLDDNIAAVAKDYGKYVTLQDDTALSRAAVQGRRILNFNKNFGIGSVVLPFAKTPANLLMRAFEYSPAGFARTIYQAGEILLKKNTDLTRADVIQSATRALLGTGMTGVGLWLADKGVLRGDSPGDKDVRNLERQTGLSQFQLNGSALQRMLGAMVKGDMKAVDAAAKIRPGDVLWQYEWAQPTSIPLAVGANVAQENKKLGAAENFGTAVNAAWGGMETLFNTSLLQGLQEAFEFPPGEENKVKAFFANLAKSAPSMFTPSFLNRINQFNDNAQRETYISDLGEYIQNSVKAKVPGLAQQLPQSVDTLGQPKTRENSFFDVFISPSQRSYFKPSEEAQMVMDLLTKTGDDRLAPRTVPRNIKGIDKATRESRTVDLTPTQYAKYQKIVGEETTRLLSRIPPNISTEAKIKRVLDALDKAGEKGRREMRKEFGMRL